MSCKAIEPCLRHSVSRSCDNAQSVRDSFFVAHKHCARSGAYCNIHIVVELDDFAEYADPLVEVGKVERVSQLVYQRVLFGLLRFGCRAFGLATRPLS